MMTDFTEFNATVWAGCTTPDYYRQNNKATAAGKNIKKARYNILDIFT